MRLRHALFVLMLIVGGCQSRDPGQQTRPDGEHMSAPAARAVAADLAAPLTTLLTPALPVVLPDGASPGLALALREALAGKGYSVSAGPEVQATETLIQLWVADIDGIVFVHLSTPSYRLARAFRTGPDGALPAGALSVEASERGEGA